MKLAKHAEAIGIDFVIILTPYHRGAKSDDAVYEFYRFICRARQYRHRAVQHPQRLSDHRTSGESGSPTIPNVCGFKQGDPGPGGDDLAARAIGKDIVVSVADETPWLHNLGVMGDQWLLNYCPHLYQVPGYLPVHDYTQAALAGDMNTATEICRALNPLRAVHAKWITGYGSADAAPRCAEQKYWMELIGMVGGPVRAPCTEMTAEAKAEMRADLEATGLLAKAAAGNKSARLAQLRRKSIDTEDTEDTEEKSN